MTTMTTTPRAYVCPTWCEEDDVQDQRPGWPARVVHQKRIEAGACSVWVVAESIEADGRPELTLGSGWAELDSVNGAQLDAAQVRALMAGLGVAADVLDPPMFPATDVTGWDPEDVADMLAADEREVEAWQDSTVLVSSVLACPEWCTHPEERFVPLSDGGMVRDHDGDPLAKVQAASGLGDQRITLSMWSEDQLDAEGRFLRGTPQLVFGGPGEQFNLTAAQARELAAALLSAAVDLLAAAVTR